MMLWWYDRTTMRLICCITGIHSSLGWLTHSAGSFQTTVTVILFFGNDPPVLVNSWAAHLPQASWTHSSWCRLLEDHMTCSKVPPICHLKGLCPQSTIETEVINKWYTKDPGPVRQIGRSLLFLWRSPLWATAVFTGGTPEGDGIFTWPIQSCHCPSAGLIWQFLPFRNSADNT